MSEISATRFSWCPSGVGARDAQGNITYAAHQENATILPDFSADLGYASTVYLPLENLLTRTFHLPLKQTRHLDAPILAQELADTAGINPEEWWLSWQAYKVDDGISGIAFGLPRATQQAIEEHPILQQTPLLLADGWSRLNSWINNNESTTDKSFAVIDTDAEGIFLGFYQAGAWQGMRRLNADMHDSEIRESITQQVILSLQSMGFSAETMPVTGRLTSDMAEQFQLTMDELAVKVEDALPQRHILNLMLSEPDTDAPQFLNIRHGKWAVRRKSSISSIWYRPAILGLSLCFLWLMLTTISNYQLERELKNRQAEITSAFHRGLPDQPVIIDALAQLRQAAQLGGDSSNNNQYISRQLNIISTVFKKHSWQMQELKADDKGVFIAGKVKNLDSLNSIRESLEAEAATSVKIVDTDLSGDEVAFKVKWK